MASQAKDLRKLLKKAEAQGFTVKEKKKGVLVLGPDGTFTQTIHFTNSDHRALANIVAQLRKGGFDPDL